MRIPITKNMSTELDDVVGFMESTDEFEDQLVARYSIGMHCKLNVCIQIVDGGKKLTHVSFSSVPVKSISGD